jgi:hypothetical protein
MYGFLCRAGSIDGIKIKFSNKRLDKIYLYVIYQICNIGNTAATPKLVRFAHNWPPARRVAPTPRRECWKNGIVE